MTFEDDLHEAEKMIDELAECENYDELIGKLEEIDSRMKELLADFCPDVNDEFWEKAGKVRRAEW